MSTASTNPEHVYQISFDRSGQLSVNSTAFPQIADNPDDALDWALAQVAAAHQALPEGSDLRVDIIDTERRGGYGLIGYQVPWGAVLTGQDVREYAAQQPAPEMFTERDNDVKTYVAPVDQAPIETVHEPLWPAPRSHENTPMVTRRLRRYEDTFTYVPREAPPAAPPEKDPVSKSMGFDRKWVAVIVAVFVAFFAYQALKPKPDPNLTYAKVCVNNLSYQRLDDEACENSPAPSSRWWYVNPNVAVPAVGNYLDEAKGSFTAPTREGATVDTGIPVDGRSTGRS